MPDIIKIQRPAGQSEEYRFYVNQDTENEFKAKQSLEENIAKQPVIKLSVSQVDEDGHALVDEVGDPIITTHSHVFTETELSDPTFDPATVVQQIMEQVIVTAEISMDNRKKLAAVALEW